MEFETTCPVSLKHECLNFSVVEGNLSVKPSYKRFTTAN